MIGGSVSRTATGEGAGAGTGGGAVGGLGGSSIQPCEKSSNYLVLL